MSKLVEYNKDKSKIRIWSTVSDRPVTKWGTISEIKRILIIKSISKLIDSFNDFPRGWFDKNKKLIT